MPTTAPRTRSRSRPDRATRDRRGGGPAAGASSRFRPTPGLDQPLRHVVSQRAAEVALGLARERDADQLVVGEDALAPAAVEVEAEADSLLGRQHQWMAEQDLRAGPVDP